jgi:hypothetical protein
MVIFGSMTCLAVNEMYLVDLQETPGKILEVKNVSWSSHPVLRPVYSRPLEGIYAIAFHRYSRPCFVDLSKQNIYSTDGLKEERIFSFRTPIQDLDYDSRGRMFFSTTTGGSGIIYQLNPHSREINRLVEFSVESLTRATRGYWNGYFAFSHDNKLFMSIDAPRPGGSSIYEYKGGKLIERFTHKEKISGFTFVNAETIYFTNFSNRVYELKRFFDVSVRHEERVGRRLNDVELVSVPDRGGCSISGRLSGGKSVWTQTSIQVLGPNVVWRNMPNGSTRVSNDGSYVLQNLPAGRYRVKTDIYGDTMAGFNPRFRTINCGRKVHDINFSFSR